MPVKRVLPASRADFRAPFLRWWRTFPEGQGESAGGGRVCLHLFCIALVAR